FCFIGPAAVLTGVLAWAYTRWGLLPNVDPLLAGLRPAVMAIILAALLKLGKKALGSAPGTAAPVALAIAVAAAVLVGVPELTALAVGGAVGTAVFYALRRPQPPSAVGPSDGPSDGPTEAPPGGTRSRSGVAAALPLAAASAGVSTAGAGAVSLWQLGLVFLKVGAVLYGSGYVLIAFLEGDLVDRLGWLSQAQLLDAIAIGQLTPGPVLTTATFVGYVLAGVPGAIVATAAIFLPSFFFVSLLNPVVPRLRRRPATAAFLDAVNVAALALMAAVTLRLASTTLVDAPAWLIAVGSAVALVRFKLSPLWLVPAAAVAGWASYGLLG
ncbi:MAG: chromate efflux transporter, partial [Acidobacteriota bacterium]